MSFKFEKLQIWEYAMELGEEIHLLTRNFPDEEKYNLSSQIRRAADSIALNISEGSIGQTNLELKKIIGYAIRSQAEVVTCLYKAERRSYINSELFAKLYQKSFKLMNMLIAFRNSIK